MENNEVIQAEPYHLNYYEYKLLTIKNPSSTCNDADLLRVAYHLRNIIGYSTIYKEWFENGKQNQRHIHLVIKKLEMPSKEQLGKMSSIFKRGKYRWTEIVQANEGMPEATLLEYVYPLKNYIWHLSPFENTDHLKYVLNDYFRKEEGIKKINNNELCDFID